MRISKSPEERKSEILEAAEMLFTTKGYTDTTVNDILNKVGIAKGTFYYYFKSKELVMDAIVMHYIETTVQAAKKVAADQNETAPEKLLRILMTEPVDAHRKEQMIEQLHQVNNAEMHQKSLVETILQLTPILTEVIEQGIAEEVFQTPYPRETVEFLLASSQFLFDEGIFHWEPQERMQKALAFTHMIETTLGAKAGTFGFLLELLAQGAAQESRYSEDSESE